MFDPSIFEPVPPWAMPDRSACTFYHSLDFDDGDSVDGPWDIRGQFGSYIGDYPLSGKTMLDVGTASGFLTFSAEKAGAQVTSLECRSAAEYNQIHFAGLPYHEDRPSYDATMQTWMRTLKNGYWYCWHKTHSRAETVYAPLAALPYWKRRFDVVLAGAILEHLSDPVSLISSLTQLARDAVIIGFTPVDPSEDRFMKTANNWDDPAANYTWWILSAGLYRRVFANVGFDMRIVNATARNGNVVHTRPTIIAERRRG